MLGFPRELKKKHETMNYLNYPNCMILLIKTAFKKKVYVFL